MEITVYEYNKEKLVDEHKDCSIDLIRNFLLDDKKTTKWIRLSANRGIPRAHTVCSCGSKEFEKNVCKKCGYFKKFCSCGSKEFEKNVCKKCGYIEKGFQPLDVLMVQFEKALINPEEFPFDFKCAFTEVEKYKSIDITNNSIILSLHYPFYNSKKQSKDECKVEEYHIKIIFTKNYLISISEKHLEQFNRVSQRITTDGMPKEKIIHPDYLAYALVKALIDNYFFVIDMIGKDIHKINDILSQKMEHTEKEEKGADILNKIQHIRIDMMALRASIYPLKTMFSELLDTESDLIRGETRDYFGNLQKHLFQLMDIVAMARDHVNSSMELVLTRTTTQMDKVMKVLTILASIFLPLTFITGLYGMNFFPQPEGVTSEGVKIPFIDFHTDPVFLTMIGIMLIMAIGMLIIFQKKHYLTS